MTSKRFVLRSGGSDVVTLMLNEPEARNPLSPSLVEHLTRHLLDIEQDDSVRCVVLTGAGKGFSAGADLRRMRSAEPLEDRDEYDNILVLNRLLWRFPKPTIAAIHGFALGAGANLASWCDIAVIDPDAQMGYPEVKAGVPSATVIPTLMRTVGRKRMYELVLTGRRLTGAEAYEYGLVSRVSLPGAAYQTALEIAREIASANPSAVRFTKEIVHVTTDMSFDQAIVYAKDLRVISRLRKDFKVDVEQGGPAGKQDES